MQLCRLRVERDSEQLKHPYHNASVASASFAFLTLPRSGDLAACRREKVAHNFRGSIVAACSDLTCYLLLGSRVKMPERFARPKHKT